MSTIEELLGELLEAVKEFVRSPANKHRPSTKMQTNVTRAKSNIVKKPAKAKEQRPKEKYLEAYLPKKEDDAPPGEFYIDESGFLTKKKPKK